MIKPIHFTRSLTHSLAIAAFAIFILMPGRGWGQTGTYTKITSLADLTDGYYVIAYGTTMAMNNTNTGSYFGNTAISPSSNAIVNPAAAIIWKIQTNATYGGRTIYNETSGKYASFTGTVANAAYAVSSITANTDCWTFAWSTSVFTVTNVGVTARLLQYNLTSPRFACYTGTQQNLTLYRLASISAPSTTGLSGFTTITGTASTSQTFTISATGLQANLVITAPANYEVRENGTGSFGSSVSFAATNGTVATKTIEVRIAATAPVGSPSGNVTCTSTGATTQNVAVSGTVNPATSAPLAPTINTITPGNATLSVAFTAGGDGGSAITDYKYSTDGGSTFKSAGTTSSPIIINTVSASSSSLVNGTTYNVQIRAVNAIGDGTVTASTAATPYTAPDAPTIGTAAVSGVSGQATVSYTAPASNGGKAITGYTATSNPGGITGTVTQDGSGTITINGLTNGTSYTFTVTATNGVTSAPSEASNAVIPFTIPGAPTIGTASVSGVSGTATVSYTAPASDGFSPIISYTATSNPGGITGTINQAGSGSITVTGLTNGTAYTFTVTATNAAGTGAASSPSNSVTPYTVPGAPTIGPAVAGNTQASVAFTAPAFNGGSAITGYTVTSDPEGLSGTGTASPIIVTGLTNGTAYTFTVTATNAAGAGAASEASNSVTPASLTAPGVPTGVTAVAGNGQATVSFTAPVNDGGDAITSYTATSSPGDITGTVNQAGSGSIIVTGLTNGTAYTFTVTATNSIGTSLPSTVSNSATPATVPGAPVITEILTDNELLVVGITAPASTGGSPIINYKYSIDGGSTFTAVSPASTSLAILITGLTNGQSYNVAIRAVNAVGDGDISNIMAATPITTPSAPTITGITAGNAQLTVAFTAPASDGGSIITNYKYSIDGGSSFTACSPAQTTGPIVITGLTNGTTYQVQIKAVSAVGDGAASNTIPGTPLKAEPASQPTALVFSAQTTSSFTTAFTAASSTPDGYIVIRSTGSTLSSDPVDGTTYANGNSIGGGTVVSVGNTISGINNTGLSAGTTYYTFVYAYNNSGALINYNTTNPLTSSTFTLCAAPAPTALNTTSTSFDINWDAVTGATSYQLDVTTDAGFTTPVSGYNGITATSPTSVTGLAANTTYYFRVRAVNASGNSAYGTGSQLTSGLAAPVATAATAVSATSFTANWGAVAGASGYKIDIYTETAGPNATDLIISEYVEGSSNNKYIEIYNGTGTAVDLSNYRLRLYANGNSSPDNDVQLSGTLQNATTIVYKNASAALSLPNGVTATANTAVVFNGDDALALYKISTSSNIDIFGRIGSDPGSAWTSTSNSTVDKTLRRKSTVLGGVTVNPSGTGSSAFTTLETEWTQYAIDNVSDLGSHTFSGGGTVQTFIVSGADVATNSYTVSGLSPNTAYKYRVRAVGGNSTSANSNVIDVTTLCDNVAITSATAAASPICSTATTTLTANGVTGTNAVVTWYTGAGGTGTNLGTGLTLSNAGPGTYYARVTGDCGTPVEASVTVGSKTAVAITSATAAASSICSTATTTLTANGVTGTNAVVTWYTGAGGSGTNLGTGLTLSNAGQGTYYARVTGDCGTPVEASVTVGSLINAGITSATATLSAICEGTTTTITATGVSGTNASLKWYTGVNGTGTDLGSNNPLTVGPGTYYARVTADCGSPAEASVTVTGNPLPTAVTASGAGTYCASTTISATNGSDGTIYFQGTTSGGTSIATPSASQLVSASGTYYFRAQSSAGCWGTEGSATVTITTPLTPAVSISVDANPVTSGSGATFTATPTGVISLPTYDWKKNGIGVGGNSDTYTYSPVVDGDQISVDILSTDLCVTSSSASSNTITMSVTAPAITVFDVTGGGSYCPSGAPTGIPVGLSGSQSGVTYTLYKGGVAQTPTVAGTGSAITFGNHTAGTYTVIANNGGADVTMNNSATIAANGELPSAYAGPAGQQAVVDVPYTLLGATATSGATIEWTLSPVSSSGGVLTSTGTLAPSFTAANSGSATFNMKVSTATPGCIANSSVNIPVTDPNERTWVGGGADDKWSTDANWYLSIAPTSTNSVIIPAITSGHYPNITGTATCKNIRIESGASLQGNENLTVTGVSVIERDLTAGQWHYFSVPNDVTTANIFYGSYLGQWDEPTAKWSYIYNPADHLYKVKGYRVWNNTGATRTYTFTGPFLSGNQSIPITQTANGTNYEGANLVGNPYPSYIDWGTLNTTYGAVYYWNNGGYVSWNGGVGEIEGQYVAPLQGFFIVKTDEVDATDLNLDAGNRTNVVSGTYYKSAQAGMSNSLVLRTESGSYADKLYIVFNPETTEGFDLANDAFKLTNSNGISALYSYSGDQKLSIDARPETESLQLGFFNTNSGQYQIGIQDIADIPVVVLEDTKTGAFHDLKTGSYTFNYDAGESDKRFILHFGINGVKDSEKMPASIYSYQKTIYIEMKDQQKGDIFVYNISGQLVKTIPSAHGNNEIKVAVGGNYIVKVVGKDNTCVKKVWIQQ